MSLAFVFPGQGAQYPTMLHALPASPAAAEVFDEARCQPDELDTADALTDTVDVQRALVLAGVACARTLTAEHGLTPQYVAGHSVGAFAAAVTAGVLTVGEALTAVTLRGQLMEEACAQGDWGMAAVSGLPTRSARDLVQRVGNEQNPLWVANINGATQTVLSGTVPALEAAAEEASRMGALNCERLDVAVASHCPVQEGTAGRMAEHLARLPRRHPTARYLANRTGRVAGTADAVLDDLAHAVAHPVQWYDATRLMAELGVTCAIETRPGHVLTRLFASATPSITALAMEHDDIAVTVRRARDVLRARR